MKKIKVIFIGTSRIYVGMAPSLDGYADNEVYNLGISALSLVDTEKYLDFVYEIHKPEKIFLGLDFFSFRKDNISNSCSISSGCSLIFTANVLILPSHSTRYTAPLAPLPQVPIPVTEALKCFLTAILIRFSMLIKSPPDVLLNYITVNSKKQIKIFIKKKTPT